MKKVELFTKPGLLPAMLITAILLVVMAFAPAQQQSGDEGWTLLKTESEISIFVSSEMCGKAPFYIFKIQNDSESKVSIEYTITVKDPTFGPATGKLDLDAKTSVVGNCNDVFKLSLPNHQMGKNNEKELISVQITKN